VTALAHIYGYIPTARVACIVAICLFLVLLQGTLCIFRDIRNDELALFSFFIKILLGYYCGSIHDHYFRLF
jgi:hypothetical protein